MREHVVIRIAVPCSPESPGWCQVVIILVRPRLISQCAVSCQIDCPRYHVHKRPDAAPGRIGVRDRKSTRLNSSHLGISYAVFCLTKKKDTCEVRSVIVEVWSSDERTAAHICE